MRLSDILKGSEYSLELFKNESISSLEERISIKKTRKGVLNHMLGA